MRMIIDVVTSLRNLRAQWNIKPKEKIKCHLSSQSNEDIILLQTNEAIISSLAGIDVLTIDKKSQKEKNMAAIIVGAIKGAVPLGDVIDVDKERNRMVGEIEELKKASKGLSHRLNNQEFAKKAPKDVVEKEKARLDFIIAKNKELQKIVNNLK